MNTRAKITQVMRRAAIAVAAVAALAAPASAATTARYAGVGGSTTDLSCTDPARPCDLFHIIQSVGSPGDEVVVEPGTYEYPFAVDIARAMNIHGVAGQPRPVLHLAGLSASVLSDSVTLRYLDLELGDGRLHVNRGPVEQVIVHGGDAACELGAPIVFRDNVCVQSSSTGSAIEVATN